MAKYSYKPYGFYGKYTDEIKNSCQQCRERIKKRIDKLDIDNCKEISRKITSPIYGEIPIDRIANILMDTCYMQRLKRIRQLSFCDLAFPNANHNRFEHSLGTYYLACKICENKDFKKERKEPEQVEKIAFKISALLHDIGHGPFSHMSDALFKILDLGKKGDNHENRARNIIWEDISEKSTKPACMRSLLYEIFEKINSPNSSISKKQFIRLIGHAIIGIDPAQENGTKEIGEYSNRYLDSLAISLLLNGPVDIDKLDYMVRDAYYTGVPYGGAADVQKICQNIYTKRGDDGKRQMIINSKIIPSIFNLFSSRFAAYKSFIHHHIPLITQEMMLREIVNYFKEKLSEGKQRKYFQYDDRTFISKLRKKPEGINKVVFEIENRLLFKRIGCFIPKQESNYKEFQKRRKKERVLAKKIGIDKNAILIVFSPQTRFYPKGIENLYIDYTGIKKNKLFSELFKGTIKDENGKSCNLEFKSEVMICCRNDKKTIEKVKRFIKKETKKNWTYKYKKD